ncbi:MAG: type II toxin-antitoxin system HicB family antitoxin [Planctomycetota bacterium]
MKTAFDLEYWRDGAWYVGRLRGVPGVFSQGATIEELEDNIRDAHRLMCEGEISAPADSRVKPIAIDA